MQRKMQWARAMIQHDKRMGEMEQSVRVPNKHCQQNPQPQKSIAIPTGAYSVVPLPLLPN